MVVLTRADSLNPAPRVDLGYFSMGGEDVEALVREDTDGSSDDAEAVDDDEEDFDFGEDRPDEKGDEGRAPIFELIDGPKD